MTRNERDGDEHSSERSDQTDTDDGIFTVVVIEAKTLHGEVLQNRMNRRLRYRESPYAHTTLPLSDLRPLADPLNVEGDDRDAVDVLRFASADEALAAVGSRSHFCQLLHLAAAAGVCRTLYIVGSPHRAIQMIDVEQEAVSKTEIESSLQFQMCHGDSSVRWPAWGIVISHFVTKMVYEGGAHVLFDDDGRNVPDAVEEVSYVQNRVARMQHAQLRVSAMKLATGQREPMPVMKYIRSSPIHAWNSLGKASVDEASRKANSLLPNALPADISCRLALRVVSLQLMNALQVWRILNAGAVLTSPHPFTTLAEMRRRMAGTILPRQFIASLLNTR